MAKIVLSSTLSSYTNGQIQVEAAGDSVEAVLHNLKQHFSTIACSMFDQHGQLGKFISIYLLRSDDLYYVNRLSTRINDEDVLLLCRSPAEHTGADVPRHDVQDQLPEKAAYLHLQEHKHKQLIICQDSETGLQALIAIHDTTLGPAIGGTRLWSYPSLEAAISDVLRLSEAMTNKAAVARLPHGGGKAVILADGYEVNPDIRRRRLRAFARIIDQLDGEYITTEDVGTTPDDMAQLKQVTPFVVGTPVAIGGSGDPSHMTAFGVFQAIRTLAEDVLGVDSLTGVRIAVQGLGKVGMSLAQQLVAAGAFVIGTDVQPEVVRNASITLGIDSVLPHKIFDVPCEIFAPCALGSVLNDMTIPRLNCTIVAGCANNQLAAERHGEMLHARGIVYGVDYVINAGGLINSSDELQGYNAERVCAKTAQIAQTVKRMLAIAHSAGISTQNAAKHMVWEALVDSAAYI